MKIGILTFHFGTNYGGILQCYALYSYLKSQGHDVEVIDYRSSWELSTFKRICNKIKSLTSIRQVVSFLQYILSSGNRPTGNQNYPNPLPQIFDEFREAYLTFSPKVDNSTINSLSDRYDYVIVGSDQVWTDLYSGNNAYFLDWIADDSPTRRISYAACSAHDKVVGQRRKQLNYLLSKFDIITVRDFTTSDLVEQITGKIPQLVADPTLIYDFSEFVSSEISGPYILAYILDSEIYGGHENAINKIREQYGDLPVKLIYIPGHNETATKFADEVMTDVTPQQWVDLFAHASFVYTDSFHAIMFAIKFNKPLFAYYTNPVRASRLLDIKKRFPLLNIDNKCPDVIERTNRPYDLKELISGSQAVLQIVIE